MDHASASPKAQYSSDHSTTIAGRWMKPLIIGLAVTAAYGNHFDGTFIADDLNAIVNNGFLRSGAFWKSATAVFAGGSPLTNMTYWFDFQLWGQRPAGYHVLPLMFHVISSIFVYFIFRRFLESTQKLSHRIRAQSELLGFSAALIWALHPIHTASVTHIGQRGSLLSAMLGIITFYCLQRLLSSKVDDSADNSDSSTAAKKIQRFGIIGCLTAAAAGFCSPAALTPPLIALTMWWFFWRMPSATTNTDSWQLSKRWSWFVAGSALGATFISQIVAIRTGTSSTTADFMHYATQQPQAMITYLKLFIWPAPLLVNYGEIGSVAVRDQILPWLAVLLGCGLAIYGGWRRHLWSAPLTLFMAALVPVLFVRPLPEVIAEPRVYLASTVLAITVVLGFWWISAREGHLKVFAGVVTVLAIGLGARTWLRNLDYRAPATLWSQVLENRPTNTRAMNELAGIFAVSGRANDALALYDRAFQTAPNNPGPLVNIANILQSAGKADDAANVLQKAIQVRPDFSIAHFQLGNLLLGKGDAENAERAFQEALKLEPGNADVLVGIGNSLALRNQYDRAIEEYHKALASQPALAQPYNNIATIYARMGKTEDAVKTYIDAIQRAPNDPSIRVNLGNSLVDMGKADEAKQQYALALQLQPGYEAALTGLKRLEAKSAEKPAVQGSIGPDGN